MTEQHRDLTTKWVLWTCHDKYMADNFVHH